MKNDVSNVLANGRNGAGIGLVFGALSFVFVGAVRLMMPETQGELRNVPMLTLALLYLLVAPALGFLGGVARTWLPGRVGRTVIAIALGAAAGAIVLPILPMAKSPWGPVEYVTIAGMGVLSGILFGPRKP
jgi:hypothetical protein